MTWSCKMSGVLGRICESNEWCCDWLKINNFLKVHKSIKTDYSIPCHVCNFVTRAALFEPSIFIIYFRLLWYSWQLKFFYHMYGVNMRNLSVSIHEVRPGCNPCVKKYNNYWSRLQHVNEWLRASMPLPVLKHPWVSLRVFASQVIKQSLVNVDDVVFMHAELDKICCHFQGLLFTFVLIEIIILLWQILTFLNAPSWSRPFKGPGQIRTLCKTIALRVTWKQWTFLKGTQVNI